MFPLSTAVSVSPVQHAGALVPFAACSKMEISGRRDVISSFLTISLEMCAELHFTVVLSTLRSRAPFWLAEGLCYPQTNLHPGTGRCADISTGLCTTEWVPSPPVLVLRLHSTPRPLAHSLPPLEGWQSAPGALLPPTLPPHLFLLPARCCVEDGCTYEGTGCWASEDRVLGGWEILQLRGRGRKARS